VPFQKIYVSTPQLPTFSGTSKEDFIVWKDTLNALSEIQHWTPEEYNTNVLTSLQGKALMEAVERMNEAKTKGSKDARNIIELLSITYAYRDWPLEKRNLQMMTQGPNESVHDFSQRIRFQKRIAGATEEDALTAFKLGLRKSIGSWLKNLQVENMDQAVSIAMRNEKNEQPTADSDDLLRHIIQLKQEITDLKKNQVVHVNAVTRRRDITCFNCGKQGHIARECRSKWRNDYYYNDRWSNQGNNNNSNNNKWKQKEEKGSTSSNEKQGK